MREPIPLEPKPPRRKPPNLTLLPEKTRQYHRTRLTSLQNVLPNLLQRIIDPAIPADELSPLEIAAREYRLSLLDDLGGAARTTAVQRSLVTTLVGSWIILNTADRYLLELATATTKHGGLIDRRAKRFVPAVLERMKIAGAFSRQLAQLGVEKASMPLPTFDELLRQPEPPTTNVHEPEEPTP